MRRAGWFRRDHYLDIGPSEEETGADLERKWGSWVAQESKKRYVTWQLTGFTVFDVDHFSYANLYVLGSFIIISFSMAKLQSWSR